MTTRVLIATGLLAALCSLAAVTAQDADGSRFTASFQGTLAVVGGGGLPDGLREDLIAAAGGVDSKVVILPGASQRADEDDASAHYRDPWLELGCTDVQLVHTRDRDTANSEEFVAPIARAQLVWIPGGSQSRLADVYAGTLVVRALRDVLDRGGVVAGTSAGAAIASGEMIARSRDGEAVLGKGFGLLPVAVIDQHFTERKRLTRLRGAIDRLPGHFGIGLDEGTALVVRGRNTRVRGRGRAHVVLGAGGGREERVFAVGDGGRLDLPQLRRAADARASQPFPGEDCARAPVPAGGTLLVGGGGRLPASVWKRFVDAAGGKDAKLVVVPTAASFGPRTGGESTAQLFERFGVRDVVVWHYPNADFAAQPDLLEPLKNATGIWFGGGRQWRLVDAYAHTPAWQLFQDVVTRGGIVGGSSAGATIQGEFLVRGHPLGNQVMMAEGYERGLALLRGCAVDQHFTERGRLPDLQAVIDRHPNLLGFGLDEGTAAVVTGTRLEVVGRGRLTLIDTVVLQDTVTRRERVLDAGESVDLIDG